MRLRVSVTPELAELVDFLAWLQMDTAQGVIRRGLAEWVVAELQALADSQSMTVDQYLDLNLSRRVPGLWLTQRGDRRR